MLTKWGGNTVAAFTDSGFDISSQRLGQLVKKYPDSKKVRGFCYFLMGIVMEEEIRESRRYLWLRLILKTWTGEDRRVKWKYVRRFFRE